MGGGAGVGFTSDKEYFSIDITKEKGEFKIDVQEIELEKFDMKGYDDGLINIDGEFLEAEVEHDITDSLLESVIENAKNELIEEEELDINEDDIEFEQIVIEYVTELDDMIWAGYVRGQIEDVTSFDTETNQDGRIEVDFKVNGRGGYSIELSADDYERFEDVSVVFKKANKNYFNDMYNAVMGYADIEDEDIKAYREERDDLDEDLTDDEIREILIQENINYIEDEFTVR